MGRIKLRWFYTELVEHYLRMAVRYKTVSKSSSQYWYDKTQNWINQLSEKDNQFIRFVFDKQFFYTSEGLYCYQCEDDMYAKRVHLTELEKDFALKRGLIGKDDTGDMPYDWIDQRAAKGLNSISIAVSKVTVSN